MIAFQKLLLICDGRMHFFGGLENVKLSFQAEKTCFFAEFGKFQIFEPFPFLSRGSLLPWEIPQPLPLSSLFPCSSLAQVINVSHHRPKAPPPLKQWTAKERKTVSDFKPPPVQPLSLLLPPPPQVKLSQKFQSWKGDRL